MNPLLKVIVLAAVVILPACQKKEESPAAVAQPVAAAAQPTASEARKAKFAQGYAMTTPGLAPADECAACDWTQVLGREAPVSYLGCIKGEAPDAHCHMEVKNSDPSSSVVVTEENGSYHFVMTTENDPDTGLDCPNLAQDTNPQVIWGKCTVRHPGIQGDAEHDFQAILEWVGSAEDGRYRIRFLFDHPPEGENRVVVIHNGEGHAHPN